MVRKGSLWILIVLFSAGCGIINIKKTGHSAERFEDYSEDLTSSRITFSELPEVTSPELNEGVASAGAGSAVDQDLEFALENFSRTKKEDPYYSGFTILVYSGVDRELAFQTRNDLYSAFPEINAEMQYQQPRYLVKVGKYINRIEALGLFEKVKSEFPAARIIQDRFQRELEGNEQELEDVEG